MTPTPAQVKVRRSFRRGLQSYRANAHEQHVIADHLADLVREHVTLSDVATSFEFGCGTGFLTEALAPDLAHANWVLNDLVAESEAFVGPIAARHPGDWQFVAGAVEELDLPGGYDLITGASAIQWVPEPRALLHSFGRALTTGGWLAFSGFAPQHFQELKKLGANNDLLRYIEARDWPAMLPPELTPVHVSEQVDTLWFDSVRDMLVHLRKTGVNGNAQQVWSRARLMEFEDAYRDAHEVEGRVPLSYAPTFVLAQKA